MVARIELQLLAIGEEPLDEATAVPAVLDGTNFRYVAELLPLSWLLAYRFDMGIVGIYIANIISMYVRAALSFARYLTRKWMYKRV